MRILIAEDDPISRKVLHYILKSVSPDCVLTENGEEAYLQFCEAADNNQPFDMVFLDVMMPEVSGQEALEAIRDYESELGISMEEGVKVVMTTALDDGKNLYQAHANGVVDYIVKPVSRDKILKLIERLGLQASVAESSH